MSMDDINLPLPEKSNSFTFSIRIIATEQTPNFVDAVVNGHSYQDENKNILSLFLIFSLSSDYTINQKLILNVIIFNKKKSKINL